MPQIFSTSRAEAAVFRFPAVFIPLLAVVALVLQTYLPVVFHAAVYLDLPLLVVIYWAITYRRPRGASLVGAVLGLAQDSLSHTALGVNGISKTVIGFLDASLGSRFDADHPGVRLLVVLVCYELNRAILYALQRFLLGTPVLWHGWITLVAALVNGLLAVILFHGFDRFRHWV
ncbi:MAG: rod shape-determining protein MreD [Acidobacteria bacterium]|nr:MAG: rod shape-determining protein MreD [Acidobacteriota bacterium]